LSRLRKVILEAAPDLTEEWKWNVDLVKKRAGKWVVLRRAGARVN
jgi:hypothetical protein